MRSSTHKQEEAGAFCQWSKSRDRTRTGNLRVMSPVRYQLRYPAIVNLCGCLLSPPEPFSQGVRVIVIPSGPDEVFEKMTDSVSGSFR